MESTIAQGQDLIWRWGHLMFKDSMTPRLLFFLIYHLLMEISGSNLTIISCAFLISLCKCYVTNEIMAVYLSILLVNKRPLYRHVKCEESKKKSIHISNSIRNMLIAKVHTWEMSSSPKSKVKFRLFKGVSWFTNFKKYFMK